MTHIGCGTNPLHPREGKCPGGLRQNWGYDNASPVQAWWMDRGKEVAEKIMTSSTFGTRVKSSLRHYRVETRLAKPFPQTVHGFSLMGSQAMVDGTFEPEETAIFQRCIQDYDVVVNIGANVGYYCCLALKAGKRVIAFEPHPTNLKILYANLWANGWQDQVEIYPVALADKPGIVRMFGCGTGASLVEGWAGAHDFTLVPALALDTLLENRFPSERIFFLMDVEGAEWFVLQGAKRVLAKQPKPQWMVEIAVQEHQPSGVKINPYLLQTFELFWEHGFEAWTAVEDSRKIDCDEIAEIIRSGTDSLGTHNFLFREPGF